MLAASWLLSAGVPSARSSEYSSIEGLIQQAAVSARIDPEVGKRQHCGIPWRMSETPCEVKSAAPTLGQHTDEVMTGLLGYTAAEVDALRAKGALD